MSKLTSKTRKALLTAIVVLATGMQVGCAVPIWSPEPNERVRQLIFTSEGYRHIPQIWDRIWGLDLPDLATPYRTHGGVI